jgi:hypothetical protein
MMGTIKRGITAAKKSGTAVLGFFLYPLLGFGRIWYSAMSLMVVSAIAIPFLAILIGTNIYHHFGLFPSIAATAISAGALFSLAFTVLPIGSFFSFLHTLLNYPLKGVSIGWNDGFTALFENPHNRERRINPYPHPDWVFEYMGQPQNGMDMAAILDRIGREAVQAARRPLTDEQFASLEMSTSEYETLTAQMQEVLTDEEVAILKNSDEVTKKLLERYENLNRLQHDNCSILQMRPERDDTIVLMKQYKLGQVWHPIPGICHIFDRESLAGWLKTDGVHPTQNSVDDPTHKDKILTPGKHKIGADEFETRYCFHKYYPPRSERGVCQEVNQLLIQLKEKLQSVPVNHAGKDDTDNITFITSLSH